MTSLPTRTRWTLSADGASLAYYDEGDGPAVVMTNGFANNTLYWEPLRRELRHRYRVIRWDLRGHGRSAPARDLATITVEGCVDDLKRVLDAAGVESAAFLGFSFGCQIILEAYRHLPDRIDALIPVLGPFEQPFSTLFHPALGPAIFALYRRLGPGILGPALKLGSRIARLETIHATSQLLGIIGRPTSAQSMASFYDHMAQLHPETWYYLGLAAQDHSARDVLPSISVPTLVIAGGLDRFSPGDVGHQMAQAIPTAELLHLEEATHTGLFDCADEIGQAVQAFLQRTLTPGAPS
jgi:pimeloyl-ACP methyl ester carboxylesterase